MRDFLSAARFLAIDFAATILFFVVLKLSGSMALATLAGVVLGVGQVGWKLARKQPVDALQWVSLGLIVVAATASLLTNDPRFVMMKPTVIYLIVGAVMLKRDWMARYMPPIAREKVPDLITLFGYVWAGLMLASAGLNVAAALALPPAQWAVAMSLWGLGSKVALFLIQFALMKLIGRRRYMRAHALA